MSIQGGVVQSGAVTPGDLTSWKAASVIQDSGTSAATAIAVLASATRVIGNQSVPMVQLGTTTYGNNGAITLSNSLGVTYPNAYAFVPANSISASNAAGWYYCTFTSGTAGTLFNNTYTSGTPAVPGTPTPFVATGQGAVAGIATVITAYQFTVAGNSFGLNGGIDVGAMGAYTNSPANKTYTVTYGTSGAIATVTQTTTATFNGAWGLRNAGVTNVQIGTAINGGNFGSSNGTPNIISGNDSTTGQTFMVQMTNATPATNNMVLVHTTVELVPGI